MRSRSGLGEQVGGLLGLKPRELEKLRVHALKHVAMKLFFPQRTGEKGMGLEPCYPGADRVHMLKRVAIVCAKKM